MSSWNRLAAAAAVVAISISGGVAWAHQAEGPEPVPPVPGAGKALGNGISETKFVPVTPCRLVDTRVGTPAPGVGQERSVAARGNAGALFTGQGGTAGGCGIPLNASALEVTITAVGPAADGYLRAYPSTMANATFLNFTKSQNIGNSGTIMLCQLACQANKDFRFKVFGGTSDIVIDVQGYDAPPMAGVIESNGTVSNQFASRLSSVRTGAGTYAMTFDRDISECASAATSFTTGRVLSAQSVTATKVVVQSVDLTGTLTDTKFHIEVIC
ncbi:MAG: hypothetical protein JWM47_2408 [Acidimicrobiales bacterium]|nr:hypothetical protein [Acidimicrobiales bacterium]